MPAEPDGRMPTVSGDPVARGWDLIEESTETRFSLPTSTVRAHTRLYEDEALRRTVRERTGIDRTWRFFFATALSFEPPLPPLSGPATAYPSVASEARRAFVDDLRGRGIRDIDRGRSERVRVDTGDRARLFRYRGRLVIDTVADATPNGSRSDADTTPNAATGRDRGPIDLRVASWLGVWVHRGDFRLAGGGYPEDRLSDALDAGADGDDASTDGDDASADDHDANADGHNASIDDDTGNDGDGDGAAESEDAGPSLLTDPTAYRDELLDLIRGVR